MTSRPKLLLTLALLGAFIVAPVQDVKSAAEVIEVGRDSFRPIHRNLLTGEPYAGEPHVRFGGRGAG